MMHPDVLIAPCHVDRDVCREATFAIEEMCVSAGVPFRYSGGTLPLVGMTYGGGYRRSLAPSGQKVLVVDLDLLPKTATQSDHFVCSRSSRTTSANMPPANPRADSSGNATCPHGQQPHRRSTGRTMDCLAHKLVRLPPS
jgi:hypothetical protein